MTPVRARAENCAKLLVRAILIASLEDRAHTVGMIRMGAATANLAKASVTGGISSNAILMKMKDADQMNTIELTSANETRFLLADVSLPILCLL